MGIGYIYPQFEVVRDWDKCTNCRICERQCAYGAHIFDGKKGRMVCDDSKCVDCQRCVCFCPTHALKIKKSGCVFRENANWDKDTIQEIYKQASSGGVLLSSMGNPKRFPVYWDRILVNASQVTNPPVDPLREPMETRVFLGRKPDGIRRDENGRLDCRLPPQIELSMPVMFSAMSYGSISYNAHACLARAARELGICYNTGEGGLHEDFYAYGENTIVQVASGRFGVHKQYLEAGAAIEIKMGQGAKPGIGGHLPGAKIVGDVSRTRMVPEGSDAISPAPHHDIYSIEDLRQLVFSLKEATEYKKPVIVKVAAVHNIAAIASGIARSGADIIAIDGFRGGTGAAPTRIRDTVGIPIELALAAVYQRPLLRGRGQGRGPGSGRLLHRHGGAAGAGLPPLPHLPDRQVLLGHRHPGPGAGQAAGHRGRKPPPCQSADGVEARDQGDDGRHGHQLHRGPQGQPAHAPGRGHDRPGAGHPGNFPRRRIISYTEYTEV